MSFDTADSKEPRRAAVDPAPPPLAQPSLEPEDEGAGLHELIGTMLGARWLILATALAALVLGLLYAKLATPIFSSDVLIQVEEKKKGIAGLEDLSDLVPTASPADTEIEILRSRSLVGQVVKGLALDVEAKPRWFSRLAGGGERIAIDRLKVPRDLEDEKLILVAGDAGHYLLRGPDGEELLQGEVGKPASAAADSVSAFVSELHARPGARFVVVKRPELEAIEKLQKDLVISEKGKKTGILRVELSGPDVARTVKTLDALSAAYVRQNVERKSEEAEKTLQFIISQLPELKARVDRSEEALNLYRSKHGSIDLPLENKAAIEKSVSIEKLATELQMEKAELAQKFTDSHPFVVAMKKKMSEVDSERSALNAQIKNLPEAELNSVRLMRDVKVSNELYVLLLNKAQELQVVKSGTIGNVRILDHALTPRKPVHPKLGQTLGLALVLGLLLGVMAAFARRALNRGVEDPDVLEAATGLGVYASVPHSAVQESFRRSTRRNGATGVTGVLAKRDPTDLAVESIRSLRTSLQFALIDAPNRVIAIGGPSPGIGKSFVSSNLAQVLADSGKRVLLIDGDMRDGHLHRVFAFERAPGLSDVIAGAKELAEALHPVSDCLDVLAGGVIPPNPSELLMSARFRELIDRAGKTYDLVVIDTPPILAVTDGALISRLAGVTLMVLRAGQHPMREVMLALKRFAQNGVRPAGLVLNDVTRSAIGGYGYGYHYQYDYRGTRAS